MMKRIDIIALNGGDGLHYKYEEVAEKILEYIYNWEDGAMWRTSDDDIKKDITNLLVKEFQ
jgi:hypothetical protein